MIADLGATPEQRRDNRRLGLLLGAFVAAVVVSFIIAFTRHGLPKDPGVWKRLHLEESGQAAPPSASATDPAPAAVRADQEPTP